MKVKTLVLVVFALVCAGGCGRGYSEGERIGRVVKLSHKGLLAKTWEGEMNLGGMARSSDGAVVDKFSFSVVDPAIVAELTKSMNSGETVKITYVQWLLNPPLSMETDYEITGVSPLTDPFDE